MKHTPFSIIPKRRIWYVLSLIGIIPGIISLFVWGLNVGIDFKGGSLLQVEYTDSRPAIETIRDQVSQSEVPGAAVQTAGDKGLIIRFPNTEGREGRKDADTIIGKLESADQKLNKDKESFETVGGTVAQSTTNRAVLAVVITSLAIIIFMAWSFASVPKPASSWRFGVTAILALLHDLIFVIGAFSVIGHFLPEIEVDALFITALLTILGFSVNDTIVVFDRIRENLRKYPNKSFEDVSNESLNQTLARSLNTSGTVLIVLLALLLIGGPSIRSFILALTLGIAVGTYSSIFNAAPLLVTWQNWADKRAAKRK
jgi:preprotein translocase subunit SecF